MNSIQKAALYMRLSKEDLDKGNAESESIQNQRMILDEYASSHGWEIYDHYIDEDFSGSDRSRPDFNRMIEDAKTTFITFSKRKKSVLFLHLKV